MNVTTNTHEEPNNCDFTGLSETRFSRRFGVYPKQQFLCMHEHEVLNLIVARTENLIECSFQNRTRSTEEKKVKSKTCNVLIS